MVGNYENNKNIDVMLLFKLELIKIKNRQYLAVNLKVLK